MPVLLKSRPPFRSPERSPGDCGRARRLLLAGVSGLALGVVVPMVHNRASANTTIGSSVGEQYWDSGNFSITSTGSVTSPRDGVVFLGSNPGGVLTNSGTISGSRSGIFGGGTVRAVTVESGGVITASIDGILIRGGAVLDELTVKSGGSISGSSVGIVNFGSTTSMTIDGSVSGRTGIENASLIGMLTNSGTITSTTGVGIRNYTTILSLTNHGRIGSGGTGLYNSGTLSAVTNSGTIQGTTEAIYNTSTGILGSIANSGVIAGGIRNDAARDLTINGGSDESYGTLTGASGGIGAADVGTILNTASNVVFGSGNILLNDAINVGANSVINNGATLKLANPISITGAYQQTGGGLVAQAASPSSYGYLAVSGPASVANASIVISGAGLASGNSFTIVRSGATGSYSGDSASVIGTDGLTATVQTVGNDLVVTLAGSEDSSGHFTAEGETEGGVAAPLGPVLDRINGDRSPDAVEFQNAVLVPLARLPQAQQGAAIKQLAPVQNVFHVVDTAATMVMGAVEQHQQETMAYNGATGEAAGAGFLPGTLWGEILGGTAHRDSNAQAAGYRAHEFGLATGFDHLFTPNLLGGVAASWVRAHSRGRDSASGQSSTLNSYQLTFYGTYRHGRAFVDGHLGAGWNRYQESRNIGFLGSTASARYDGYQTLVDGLAGYDFTVGGRGSMVVTPLAGLRWLRARNGAYSESGAGAADLSVGRQTVNSVTQQIGVKGSWLVNTAFGRLEPEVTLAWLHDYTHGAIPVSGSLGGQAFVTTTPRISANGARIDIAATLMRSAQLSIRAEYDGDLRSGYQSHTGIIKASWNF